MVVDDFLVAFKEKTIKCTIDNCITELNDDITNEVRKYLDNLPIEEVSSIKTYLETILNICYHGGLFDADFKEEDLALIDSLSEKEIFLLKQFALYFYGRLSIKADLLLLKKIYRIDDNKYIQLNIVFSTLPFFDEEIEMDFINKVLTLPEYDLMIRSWSLAFFRKVNNPYEYRDNTNEDWAEARIPRIKRLAINDEDNPKYKKAIAYRLLDLAVIYLYKKSRSTDSLTDEDKDIIKNTFIDYELYSETKRNMMKDLIKKILL